MASAPHDIKFGVLDAVSVPCFVEEIRQGGTDPKIIRVAPWGIYGHREIKAAHDSGARTGRDIGVRLVICPGSLTTKEFLVEVCRINSYVGQLGEMSIVGFLPKLSWSSCVFHGFYMLGGPGDGPAKDTVNDIGFWARGEMRFRQLSSRKDQE